MLQNHIWIWAFLRLRGHQRLFVTAAQLCPRICVMTVNSVLLGNHCRPIGPGQKQVAWLIRKDRRCWSAATQKNCTVAKWFKDIYFTYQCLWCCSCLMHKTLFYENRINKTSNVWLADSVPIYHNIFNYIMMHNLSNSSQHTTSTYSLVRLHLCWICRMLLAVVKERLMQINFLIV